MSEFLENAVVQAVRRYSSAKGEAEAKQAGDELLAAIRQECLRVAMSHFRLGPADAEDIAQKKSFKLFECLTSDRVDPEKSAAFVYRCAERACKDLYRARKHDPLALANQAATGGRGHDSAPAHSLFDEGRSSRGYTADPEQANISKQQLELAMGVLSKLPPQYRAMLEACAFENRSLEELAEEELRRSATDKSGAPRGLKQARNSVDQRLHRARSLFAELFAQARRSS